MARRERFLGGMNEAMTWQPMVALIEPHYLAAGQGTQPMPLERMPRIHFMQRWFNGLDPAMGDALHDSESMRRFAGIELVEDAFPDESTVLRFRHLLERHGPSEQISGLVRGLLEQGWSPLKSGKNVDALPSTTNEAKARDPKLKQGKKNAQQWHFGMKAHVSTDPQWSVHTLVTTHAGASEFNQLPKLLRGEERELYGDQAYWSEMHRIATKVRGVRCRMNRRAHPGRPLSECQCRPNRLRSAARARGEHAFHVVKWLWGCSKVRYRGLATNTARLFTIFALANLYLVQRRLYSTHKSMPAHPSVQSFPGSRPVP